MKNYYAQGLFILGKYISEVEAKQRQKDIKSLLINRLNLRGILVQKVLSVVAMVDEMRKVWETYYDAVTENYFRECLQGITKSSLLPEEVVFHILAGRAYEDYRRKLYFQEHPNKKMIYRRKIMIKNNSEILFLYDAQMCNPNGDMDNENKPRMDYDSSINLVSDVRLKRYIRDYFEDIKNQEIFISNKAKDAKERNKQIKEEGKTHCDLIDVRLFGAVTTEEDRGSHFTGLCNLIGAILYIR